NTPTPWFVDQEYLPTRAHPPHSASPNPPQETLLPPDLPPHLNKLHSELSRSPHVERGGVQIRPPPASEAGPSLPSALPKGRRRRGRTDIGLGVPDNGGTLWRWIVIAQVKEGTENRGAIESVMRVVRKALLTAETPVVLPPNKKRRIQDGWGMLDAGDFAVHILSRDAREKYF
ncbi:uncharacterized protein FOMMEDRAFT_59638, partial [Fomitiporia mediterranea MF3/22]|uniref:uncharacterized protein n=1 Tax=Fomitiporia mediterranea (strain MF3/22) TaxID=694068 RepID=UPI0004408DC4